MCFMFFFHLFCTYLSSWHACSLASCLVHRSRFKYQFMMYQTKICHFCTTFVKLNARWLSRCSIYWNVNASTSKYQLMCWTKIYHCCITLVELNARWLTRCLIYWTVNDSRSKYQLICWRHPTFLDTGHSYRGNQFIELCIYTPTVLPHPPIHSLLCSLTLLHPASVGRKAASRMLTTPSPPTSPAHKSSARHICFSAPSESKVTALDLLLH
jgi:hypothetical protein